MLGGSERGAEWAMRNVDAIEMGEGVLTHAAAELKAAAVLTMPAPWEAVRAHAAIEPARLVMLQSVEQADLDQVVDDLRGVPAVAGVGGGMAIDAGKYVAWRLGVPCISVPTAVSTTAFANSMVALRRDAQVVYVGEDEIRTALLVIDFGLIGAAPRQLNVAGVADLLAVHTACVDWEIACAAGVADHPLETGSIDQSRDIVRWVVDRADVIREMNGRAIKLLVDLCLEAVEIEAAHPRMGEGSEHYLVYLLERLTGRSFQHGMVVGMALDVVSALQDDGWHDRLCAAMDKVGLAYAPRDLDLSRELVRDALERLPDYVVSEGYWFSVINAVGIPDSFVEATLERLAF